MPVEKPLDYTRVSSPEMMLDVMIELIEQGSESANRREVSSLREDRKHLGNLMRPTPAAEVVAALDRFAPRYARQVAPLLESYSGEIRNRVAGIFSLTRFKLAARQMATYEAITSGTAAAPSMFPRTLVYAAAGAVLLGIANIALAMILFRFFSLDGMGWRFMGLSGAVPCMVACSNCRELVWMASLWGKFRWCQMAGVNFVKHISGQYLQFYRDIPGVCAERVAEFVVRDIESGLAAVTVR
jgi:hypothetical protein